MWWLAYDSFFPVEFALFTIEMLSKHFAASYSMLNHLL